MPTKKTFQFEYLFYMLVMILCFLFVAQLQYWHLVRSDAEEKIIADAHCVLIDSKNKNYGGLERYKCDNNIVLIR